MSLTNLTTHQHSSKHQSTSLPSNKAKRSHSSKKVLLHHSMPTPPLDDWVLFPQDIVTEKNSSVRHAPSGRHARLVDECRQTLPLHDSHVTEPKATTPAGTGIQRPRKPYSVSKCLDHMSARNCTVDCIDATPLPPPPANMKMPPKAPSPPRLLTPDIPDVEEDDLWSCCSFPESNESNESTQTSDVLWNDMNEKLTQAITWQRKERNEPRKSLQKAAR